MKAPTHRVYVFNRVIGLPPFPMKTRKGDTITLQADRGGESVTIATDRKRTIRDEAALFALLNPMFPCTFRKGDVVECLLTAGGPARITMGVSRRFDDTADFKAWVERAEYTLSTGRGK